MNKKNWLWMAVLHAALMVYSCSGIFSKSASQQTFLSVRFCLLYGGMLCILVIYAVLWQQILKHIQLTMAFANKAITIVWGMLIGAMIFHEQISPKQMIAAGIIIIGVVLYVLADAEVNRQ